jgi:tRNA pseudouridine38-40 synthase
MGYYPYEVDFEKIKSAASQLVGLHNFKAFCSADTSVSNFEREIFSVKVSKRAGTIKFEICGNGFLYNMVRIIVGTLLDIGRGKLDTSCIQSAFSSCDRSVLGKTIEPNGLYLKSVKYE